MGLYPRGNDHRDQDGVEQSLAKRCLIGNSHPGIKRWESWALGQEGGGKGLHFISVAGILPALGMESIVEEHLLLQCQNWCFIFLSVLKMLSCFPLAEGKLSANVHFRITFAPFDQFHFSIASLLRTGKPSSTLTEFRRLTTAQAKLDGAE